MTKEQIVHALREQRELLGQRYPIQRLAHFGSWAHGDTGDNGNVDVLVEVDASIGIRFVDLAEELERALGLRVDLVSWRSIKPAHWKRIEPDLINV